MKPFPMPLSPLFYSRPALSLGLASFILALSSPILAQDAARTLMLDDFEDGVGRWTRNDKTKSLSPASPVLLVDVLATRPSAGGAVGSQGAGLFAYKAGVNSWASASLRINGKDWAKIGARSIRFFLDADGQTPGVGILLRGTARNPDGSTRDVVYEPLDPKTKKPVPVRLSTKSWRQVVVPLSSFRDPKGASVLSNLGGLYLLQFVQRGTWNSRFFTLDDLAVSGTGVPIPIATATPTGTTRVAQVSSTSVPVAAPTPAPDAIPVEIDFLRLQGRIRAAGNISVGAKTSPDGTSSRPFDDPAFATAIKVLNLKMVRLEAGEMVELLDSSRPSFDFSALQSAARAVRASGAEPLICLSAPSSWGLEAAGYASYASQAARALTQGTTRGPRLFELSLGGQTPGQAVSFYRAAYAALKAANKNLRVGGIGTSNAASLDALIKNAPGLDFLSISFYGATSGTPDVSTLLNATLSLPALRSAAQILDRSRFRLAPLYITSAGFNAARSEEGTGPGDTRLGTLAASAWWSSFLMNGSRLADQVFYNDAASPDWGLVNEAGSAFPPYYALYLWNTFFPGGSQRVGVKVSGDARGVQVLGANTRPRTTPSSSTQATRHVACA
jgi:hypothetical protein